MFTQHKFLDKIRRQPFRSAIKFCAIFHFTFLLYLFIHGYTLATLKAPPPSILLLDRDQQFIAEISSNTDFGYGYWPVDVWPERVVNALLVLEDQRFWQHPGIDFYAIARAVVQNIKNGRRISGASTITMQVARMQNPRPRTYLNKCIEAATALWLTARYDRKEIMAHYLRLVPYGNNIHGIAYASERYFNKPAADLSWAEIAMLSAIPQSPTHNNPLKESGRKRALDRANRSLEELYNSALISDAQYQLALQQLSSLQFPKLKNRPRYALHSIAKLEKELLEHPPLKHRIQSSLSLPLQREITVMANRHLQDWKKAGADNVAAIVINNETMEVLSWVGSSDYFSDQGGAIDYAKTYRSPGSTFKPFIYALALEQGLIDTTTLLPDLQSVGLGIENSDRRFLGPMLPRQALANSRNVPAINLVRDLGVNESLLFLEQLQLTKAHYRAGYYGAGIAIGIAPSTLESLVQAYALLANDGTFQTLRWYSQQPAETPKQFLSKDVSRLITLFLSDPTARLPSFPRMGTTEYSFPVAVKTGTSQGYRDAWTLAFTRQFTVGVWVGRSDARPMNKLSGASSAAQLTQDIFNYLVTDQTRASYQRAFSPPDNFLLADICGVTGRSSDANCHQRLGEWVKPNQIKKDTLFRSLTIDTRNGLLAGQWTPTRYIEKKIFLDLPYLYQSWMTASGWQMPPLTYSDIDNPDPTFYNNAISGSGGREQFTENDITLSILSPSNNQKVSRIPDLPDSLNTLSFSIDINTGSFPNKINQVLWYVDNKPVQVTFSPFHYRWPLRAGRHQVYAELPYFGIRSKTITVHVN